jgi:hypothetical protein
MSQESAAHPLLEVLFAAAANRFPPTDGVVEAMPPDVDDTHAVVEMTAHSYVLTDRDLGAAPGAPLHGYGGCTHPDVLRWLAGPRGAIGSVDVVLVASGRPGEGLPERTDLEDHPRVQRARANRRDVRVLGDERGLVTIGSGLVGRVELSVELTGGRRRGDGRALIVGGLESVPAGSVVFAQVSPGNANSLRAFLACGFVPIGGEVLVHPEGTAGAHGTITKVAVA